MKIFIILLTLFASVQVFAKDPADLSGCKGAAVKAAAAEAKKQYKNETIKYGDGSTTNVRGKGSKTTSTYALSLEHCSNSGCGSISYDVVTKGRAPQCTVTEVELSGEE